MNAIKRNENITAASRPAKINTPAQDRLARRRPAWKPEPCAISRQEMRRIVLEMIG